MTARRLRVVGWIVSLLAVVFGALWFSLQAPPPVVSEAPPPPMVTPPAPGVATPVESPVESPPASSEVDAPAEPDAPPLRLPKCRLRFDGAGPPLVVRFVGAAPEGRVAVNFEWDEEGLPRRWIVPLRTQELRVWPCSDETEVSVTRGRFRLAPTRVPRSGDVVLRLELAPEPSELVVRTVRPDGAPVDGVRVSVTGCQPVKTADGGVAQTECEHVEGVRRAVPQRPWRSATPTSVEVSATEVRLVVVGEDEVLPGRVGMGFSSRGTTPEVAVVMKAGPAERAGVRVGDEVLEVDGVGISTVEEAMARVVGPPGEVVRLKLRRGADVLLIDIARQP